VAASLVEAVVLFGMGSSGARDPLVKESARHDTGLVERSLCVELVWTMSRRLVAVLGGLDGGSGLWTRGSGVSVSSDM
jgi:hypothetical protein